MDLVLDANAARLPVDIDDRDMHGIAPDDRLRLSVIRLFEAGLGYPGEAHPWPQG
jgi:hypothetical protein